MGAKLAKPEGRRGDVDVHLPEMSSSLSPFDEMLLLVGHERPIVQSCLVDENLIATASDEGMIHVWNFNTGERMRSYLMSFHTVDCMASNFRSSHSLVAPKRLMAVALEGQVMIFDLLSSDEDLSTLSPQTIKLQNDSMVTSMIFVSDSILLIANRNQLISWDFRNNTLSTTKKDHDISSMILMGKTTVIISYGPFLEVINGRRDLENCSLHKIDRKLPFIPNDTPLEKKHREVDLIKLSSENFLLVTSNVIEMRNRNLSLIKTLVHENTKVAFFSMNGNLPEFDISSPAASPSSSSVPNPMPPSLSSSFSSSSSSSLFRKNASSGVIPLSKEHSIQQQFLSDFQYLATIHGQRLSVISLKTFEVVAQKEMVNAEFESLVIVDKYILTATNQDIYLWSTENLILGSELTLKRMIRFQSNTKLFRLDGKSFAAHADDCVIVVWRNVLLLKEEYELYTMFHRPQTLSANKSLYKPPVPTFTVTSDSKFDEN